MKQIDYLGFVISENGIEPGKTKILAVKNFPEPMNVRNVREFIGLTSYFRRFVKNYAIIARPITDLLSKSCKFIWGDKQQEAFEQMK